MSSPNEPGAANKADKGDSLNGDGSPERSGAHRATPVSGPVSGPASTGSAPETGDSPPWQRGPARASRPAQRPAPEPADARVNRFVSGTSASQTQEFDAPPARGEGPSAEAYASELPDLSGPSPRPAQRKPAPERSSTPSDTAGKGRPAAELRAEARSESREQRDSRVQVSRRGRGPVRASMQIRRIDPWSTLKVSLLLSVALFFVWMIAVAFLYLVLGGMGVWSKLNSNVGDLLNNTSGSAGELVSSGTIFGGAVLIGLVNIVLLTAMATIAAFVYNLATDLIGGIEVTLADLD